MLAFTPGPSVLLATANSMNYGTRKTVGTILGDLSANFLQMVLASLGLASIVVTSGELFQLIKWLGVAYLIYMGIRKIVTKPAIDNIKAKKQQRGFWSLYSEGFLMSAANPKAIVFFAALFPLFINPQLPFVPQVIVLTLTYLTIDGISLLIYSVFATRLQAYLQNTQKLHWQNRIVGILLIISGLMLSFVKRSPR